MNKKRILICVVAFIVLLIFCCAFGYQFGKDCALRDNVRTAMKATADSIE